MSDLWSLFNKALPAKRRVYPWFLNLGDFLYLRIIEVSNKINCHKIHKTNSTWKDRGPKSYKNNNKLTTVPRKGWGPARWARGLGAAADGELCTSCDLSLDKLGITGHGFSNKSVTEMTVSSNFVK